MSVNLETTKYFGKAILAVPAPYSSEAIRDISDALTVLLADSFALYLKTKNFHWHMAGPHFRDYHLLLDEQSAQIYAATDAMAERVRKIGGKTLRSIGDISRRQRILDNDSDNVVAHEMMTELRDDNQKFSWFMRQTHALCQDHSDMASTSLLENWIDEAEGRAWFLLQMANAIDSRG
jgi:starvation-inducible DNA-binding protein